MTKVAQRDKLLRIRYYDAGVCINGCGRPWVLPCGLCRTCADKRNANKRAWKLAQKLKTP